LAAVVLLPHQAGGGIRDRAVAVGLEFVFPYSGSRAHRGRAVFLFAARADFADGIALDAAIGEIDPEHGFVAAHGGADIAGAGRVLRVDDAVAIGFFAVLEFENGVVDERLEVSISAGIRSRVGPLNWISEYNSLMVGSRQSACPARRQVRAPATAWV